MRTIRLRFRRFNLQVNLHSIDWQRDFLSLGKFCCRSAWSSFVWLRSLNSENSFLWTKSKQSCKLLDYVLIRKHFEWNVMYLPVPDSFLSIDLVCMLLLFCVTWIQSNRFLYSLKLFGDEPNSLSKYGYNTLQSVSFFFYSECVLQEKQREKHIPRSCALLVLGL
jgi:hypothetical protein